MSSSFTAARNDKVVFNFESGRPVTVENAQSFTTFHPRCGTSFLMLLMIVSLVIYPFVPVDGFLPKLLIRLGLLPLVVGVCYELIRFAAKKPGFFMRILTAPGLWLQRITTQPPSDDQGGGSHPTLDGAATLERRAGWRTGYRLKVSMQFVQKLGQLEKRFEELTQQMADPGVISDGDRYCKVTKGTERTFRLGR